MDVGFYLGELLMQQGEVSVPGLGYFVQVRISGYYDDAERKFYPPYHQAQFDVQSIDDDSLAEYIANKKNISVASARYFCEKYITNLKQQAAITEVQIGNLGWFYTELSQLTFRPADKIIDDTIFFGFEPISFSKASDRQAVPERPKVELVFPTRRTEPPVVPPPPTPKTEEREAIESLVGTYETSVPLKPDVDEAEPVQQPVSTYQTSEAGISPEFFEPVEEEQEENKGPLRLILVILIVIVFIGLGIFALYRYQPDTFAKIAFWKKNQKVVDTIKPKATIPSNIDTPVVDTTRFDTVTNKIDTIDTRPASAKKNEVITRQPVTTQSTVVEPAKQTPAAKAATVTNTPVTTNTVAANTPAKNAAAKPVTIIKTESTAMRSSDATGKRRFEVFVSPACRNVAEANQLIARLKKKGLDPRVVTDAAGPLIHISIGHFKTAQEAKAYAVKVQETGKVTGDAYPNEIIPQ